MSDVRKSFRQGADIVLKQVCYAHHIFFARKLLQHPPSAGKKSSSMIMDMSLCIECRYRS